MGLIGLRANYFLVLKSPAFRFSLNPTSSICSAVIQKSIETQIMIGRYKTGRKFFWLWGVSGFILSDIQMVSINFKIYANLDPGLTRG
jgi:hypothetical protein